MSQEKTAFEREMARKNNSVITIKNIDKEDFSHTYDGFSYEIKAGETLPFQFPVGMLMAKHLAMKLVRKKAKEEKDFKSNTDKKSINLYAGKALEPYINKIVISTVDKPLPAEKTEGAIMADKTAELQRNFRKESASKPQVDKKDVIAELKKRGVKHDPRASKEDLLGLLTEAEMQGNDGVKEE